MILIWMYLQLFAITHNGEVVDADAKLLLSCRQSRFTARGSVCDLNGSSVQYNGHISTYLGRLFSSHQRSRSLYPPKERVLACGAKDNFWEVSHHLLLEKLYVHLHYIICSIFTLLNKKTSK